MLDSIKTRLTEIKDNFSDIQSKLSMPDVINDQKQYAFLSKEYSNLKPIVEKFEEYIQCESNISSAEEVLNESDIDLTDLAKEEIKENNERISEIEIELKNLLIPVDENDDKNVFVEVRAGTGGEEAALFANKLFAMYQRYAEKNRWKFEVLEVSETGIGGYKDASALISGKNVFAKLKFESGVHRVQRVPETESSGRVHTSAATVAVLPEAQDVDVKLEEKDLKIDVYRSSGPGGQSVNTTDSAVRITHLPTGVTVSMQDEKSQIKNKEKAMKVLRSRIYEAERDRIQREEAKNRKSQVGSGDRSERIRTYNFPQNRVTDHRINLTLYKIEEIMMGDLDEVVSELQTFDQTQKLAEVE